MSTNQNLAVQGQEPMTKAELSNKDGKLAAACHEMHVSFGHALWLGLCRGSVLVFDVINYNGGMYKSEENSNDFESM